MSLISCTSDTYRKFSDLVSRDALVDMEQWIMQGFDVNGRFGFMSFTCLHYLAHLICPKHSQTDHTFAHLLIQHGAQVDLVDSDGCTALQRAQWVASFHAPKRLMVQVFENAFIVNKVLV